ncbi:unnamed protein product [Clavelina lepadiformis]|uniref:Uncharacterized protein n=1 Tax=Clavelina lepadiformis TaxID=159417 RepID=A0ABP0G8I5_CLALP
MSVRSNASVASTPSVSSSSDPLLTSHRLMVPSNKPHPFTRRSSLGSLTSPHHSRQGGLRRRRLSQRKFTSFRDVQLSVSVYYLFESLYT